MDAYLSNTVPLWPTRILYLVSNFSSFIFQPVSAFSISVFCFQLWHFGVRFQASACTCRNQRIYFSAFCIFWSFGFQLIGFSFYLLKVRMQLLTFAIFRVSPFGILDLADIFQPGAKGEIIFTLLYCRQKLNSSFSSNLIFMIANLADTELMSIKQYDECECGQLERVCTQITCAE